MKTYKEFITELSGGTLARYIVKASGQLRNAAARHGQNTVSYTHLTLPTNREV